METASLGEVLELVREPIEIDPSRMYERLGLFSFGRGVIGHPAVAGTDVGKLRWYRVRANELVLSNQMAWEGAIGVTTHEDERLVASNRFLTYAPRDPSRVHVSFLRYLLLSDYGMALIRAGSPGSTIRNRTLGIKAFEAIKVQLPGIEEQRTIAARLESIQEMSSTALSELDAATGLYTQLVSALVHRPDLTETGKRHLGWQHVGLEEVLTLDINAVPVEDEETYPMVGVYSFGRGVFRRDDLPGESTSYKKLHRLCAGQLVMSRLKGWEGALALVPERFNGSHLSPEFPTFSINRALAVPGYLEALVASEPFWSNLARESTGLGARRERVHAEDLLAQQVWLPPLSGQRQTEAHLTQLRATAHEDSRREMLKALVPSAINATFADFA